jgi:hypothetical protein
MLLYFSLTIPENLKKLSESDSEEDNDEDADDAGGWRRRLYK